MKILQYKETWGDQEIERFIFLTYGNRIMCSFHIVYEEGFWPEIQAVWVVPGYRKTGLTRKMINKAIEHLRFHQGIQLQVHKDNFIKKTYIDLGFKFHSDTSDKDIQYFKRENSLYL